MGFSYAPDFRDLKYGFTGARCRPTRWATTKLYSPYSGVNAFSVPSASESASMNFSLNQTLEMKGPEQARHLGCAQGQDHRRTGAQQFLQLPGRLDGTLRTSESASAARSSQELPASNSGVKNADPYRVTPDGRRYNKLFFPGRVTSTGWSFNYTFQSSENRTTPALNDITTQDPLYANPFIDPTGA